MKISWQFALPVQNGRRGFYEREISTHIDKLQKKDVFVFFYFADRQTCFLATSDAACIHS
jgi:hypothetical protein